MAWSDWSAPHRRGSSSRWPAGMPRSLESPGAMGGSEFAPMGAPAECGDVLVPPGASEEIAASRSSDVTIAPITAPSWSNNGEQYVRVIASVPSARRIVSKNGPVDCPVRMACVTGAKSKGNGDGHNPRRPEWPRGGRRQAPGDQRDHGREGQPSETKGVALPSDLSGIALVAHRPCRRRA